MPLNISKVAVGCASLDALRARQAQRLADGVVPIVTRFRPKRADELVGGSIYWIVKHRIAARQTYFTHMCHDLSHAATTALLPPGIALAYDGLQLDVPATPMAA